MKLTEEEFRAELRYQGLMAILRRMLSCGLLSEAEYDRTARRYAAKLDPKTGSLLARAGPFTRQKLN